MPDDPHQRAQEIQDERAKAAKSEDERRKIKEQPVEPLLDEPGKKTREWD
ncbi:hypothetical protein [Falsirhodobacter halotolerans]|nr:hypothetical protein [Falsirhodobacter halotolerans]MCJ8139993.1 hypothetical protein [Falsirhodobacter halotolerans]